MMFWVWCSWAVIGIVLCLSVFFDLRSRRIPNAITLPAIVAGVLLMGILSISHRSWAIFLLYIAAFTLSVIFCMGMERGGAWAAGDSKLFLAVSAWVAGMLPSIWATGMLIGLTALLHVALIIIRRIWAWWHTPRIRWIGWALPAPSGQAWPYPGALTIAAATVCTCVGSIALWGGWG